MKPLSGKGIRRRQAKKRMLAIALLVCFTASALLFGAFILAHANHVHTYSHAGDICTTCANLQNAEQFLKKLGTTAFEGLTFLVGIYAAAVMAKAACVDIAALTPITTKARMNR